MKKLQARNLQLIVIPVALAICQACSANRDTSPDVQAVSSVSPELKTEKTHADSRSELRSNLKTRGNELSANTANAKCAALIAKAELDAAVLALPTLAASVDKEGEGQVSLSYDLMNIAAIDRNKKAALTRCVVNQLLDDAKALQKLSARSLTKPGAVARIRSVDKKLGRFEEIREELNAAVTSKEIKENARAKVFKVMTSLLERTNNLRSRARVQGDVDFTKLPSYLEIERDLHDAITHQHLLRTQTDFSRNVRLTLSGGYSFENEDDPQDDASLEGFGRASLSIRLGALSPDWREAKSEELRVELEALYEPKTGALWRISDTYRQNKIALSTLREKRGQLKDKIKLTRQKEKPSSKENSVENILIELELLKLQSEIVEVETNIQVLSKAQQMLVS